MFGSSFVAHNFSFASRLQFCNPSELFLPEGSYIKMSSGGRKSFEMSRSGGSIKMKMLRDGGELDEYSTEDYLKKIVSRGGSSSQMSSKIKCREVGILIGVSIW